MEKQKISYYGSKREISQVLRSDLSDDDFALAIAHHLLYDSIQS